jgi:hypothetical protein
MSVRQHALLAVGLALVWILGNTALKFDPPGYGRLVSDDLDRAIYAQRGSWALNGTVPYRDVLSEYPQVATYLMGVPYLVAPTAATDLRVYHAIVTGMMLAFLHGTIALLYRMLPTRKGTAFFLLLPGPFYFAYNRFDIVPSFLTLLSLFYLQRGRRVTAAVWLGTAALAKWYPALLLPAFVSYQFTITRRLDWKMILAFGITCLVILAPTAAAGGLTAVMLPYVLHSGRGAEWVSLPILIRNVGSWLRVNINPTLLNYSVLACSVVPAALSGFARIATFDGVLRWALIVVATFTLFSRIWSPQWVLWVLPLMILTARTVGDTLCIVAYGILTYVAFPILFDYVGSGSPPLKIVSAIVFAILVRTIVISIRRRDPAALRVSPVD